MRVNPYSPIIDAEAKTREKALKEDLNPVSRVLPVFRILQGLCMIGIGIFLLVVNSGSPYKEITGHVQDITSLTNANEQYDVRYLQISTDPNTLYIFDKNALHPTWTNQFFKNARVDVYYSDATPRRIGALQMYDLSGRPTTKFTTTDYTNSQNASPISNIGLDIGVILLLLGVLWAGNAIFKLVRTLRQSI